MSVKTGGYRSKFGSRSFQSGFASAQKDDTAEKWRKKKHYLKYGAEYDPKAGRDQFETAGMTAFLPAKVMPDGSSRLYDPANTLDENFLVTGPDGQREYVQVNFGGREMLVHATSGIRIHQEGLFVEEAREEMERRDYIERIVDMVLLAGDQSLIRLCPQVYKEGNTGAEIDGKNVKFIPSVINSLPPYSINFSNALWQLKQSIERHLNKFTFEGGDLPNIGNFKSDKYGNANTKHIESQSGTGRIAPADE